MNKKTGKTAGAGIVYVVGAGSIRPEDLLFDRKPEDLVIAADAGYLSLKNAGIEPDVLVADFDSMPEPVFHGKLVRLPVVKDDTDTVYAVKVGLSLGYRKFVLLGALGGSRFSHSLANLQTLAFLEREGGEGELKYGNTSVKLLSEGDDVCFSAADSGTVSLFSYSERSEVTIRGLQYEGEAIELRNDFPLGVSNHLTGTPGEIIIRKGTVVFVHER